jgi:hypothetical protein
MFEDHCSKIVAKCKLKRINQEDYVGNNQFSPPDRRLLLAQRGIKPSITLNTSLLLFIDTSCSPNVNSPLRITLKAIKLLL